MQDCEEVVGKLTDLRKRLMNDECLEELNDDFVDAQDWKNLFKHYTFVLLIHALELKTTR